MKSTTEERATNQYKRVNERFNVGFSRRVKVKTDIGDMSLPVEFNTAELLKSAKTPDEIKTAKTYEAIAKMPVLDGKKDAEIVATIEKRFCLKNAINSDINEIADEKIASKIPHEIKVLAIYE